ncbi:Hypothetical predicted protein, partial [Pelobates cultripes]
SQNKSSSRNKFRLSSGAKRKSTWKPTLDLRGAECQSLQDGVNQIHISSNLE